MPSDPPLENNENVHIPRPPNAFMKFRSSLKGYTPPQEELAICNGSLSRWFGDKWKAMTKEEKKPFEVLADRAKEAHEIAYPGYVYRPRSKEQKEQERLARMAAGLPKLKKTRATPGTENSAVASGSGHHLTSPVTMALPSVPSNTVFFPPASLGSTSATLPLPPIHPASAVAQMNPVAYTTNTSLYQSPVTYQLHEQPQEALYQSSLTQIQPDTQQPIVWTQSLIELLLQYVQYSQVHGHCEQAAGPFSNVTNQPISQSDLNQVPVNNTERVHEHSTLSDGHSNAPRSEFQQIAEPTSPPHPERLDNVVFHMDYKIAGNVTAWAIETAAAQGVGEQFSPTDGGHLFTQIGDDEWPEPFGFVNMDMSDDFDFHYLLHPEPYGCSQPTFDDMYDMTQL